MRPASAQSTLHAYVARLRKSLGPAADADLEIAEAVARLRRYSLVERTGSVFRVHRLVQAAARHRLTAGQRAERLAEAAALLVAAGAENGRPLRPGNRCLPRRAGLPQAAARRITWARRRAVVTRTAVETIHSG